MPLGLVELATREIMDLQLQLSKNEKKKKNMNEINAHDKYDDYLTCKAKVLGDDETAYPPYGKFRYVQMLLHVVEYLRHLECYRYLDSEVNIFLKSLEDTQFLQYKNDGSAMWAFEYELQTGILKLIKIFV